MIAKIISRRNLGSILDWEFSEPILFNFNHSQIYDPNNSIIATFTLNEKTELITVSVSQKLQIKESGEKFVQDFKRIAKLLTEDFDNFKKEHRGLIFTSNLNLL